MATLSENYNPLKEAGNWTLWKHKTRKVYALSESTFAGETLEELHTVETLLKVWESADERQACENIFGIDYGLLADMPRHVFEDVAKSIAEVSKIENLWNCA